MNIKALPLRNIIRKPVRTTALIILVAFLSFVIFTGSIIVISLQKGSDSLSARLGADIVVIPDEAKSKVDYENMLLQGTPGYFYMSRSYLDKIKEVEGVKQASAQTFLASLKADCCSVAVQVIGFDPETDFSIQPWIRQSSKKNLEYKEVVVGSRVSAAVGSLIKLYDIDCKVIAKLDDTGTGLDTAVYTNLETIKALMEASKTKGANLEFKENPDNIISSIYIDVYDGYNIEDVAANINVKIRHVHATKTKSMFADVSDGLRGISRSVKILISIVWIMALVIMIIAFSVLINERKKEFAVLRVLGTSRKRLGKIILIESFLLSIFGAAAGVGAGFITVFPFSGLIEKNLGLPFLMPSVGMTALITVLTIIAALVVGPIASAYSAFRLSRVDTARILKEGN